jgi:hypothetical protein
MAAALAASDRRAGRVRRALVTLIAVALLAPAVPACRAPADDEAGSRAAERQAGEGDTVVWGSDRTGLAPESLAVIAAAHPDRIFLEGMIDQYASLDYLIDQAWQPSRLTTVPGFAWRRDRKDDVAKARVVDLLRTAFHERYEPVVAASDRIAADSLRRLSGTGYERALYDLLRRRHRETLAFVDDLLPRLRRRDVRALAQRLRDYHGSELATLDSMAR